MPKKFFKYTVILLVLNCLYTSKCFSSTKTFYGSQFAKTILEDSLYNSFTLDIFKQAHLDSAGLDPIVFQKAITGFYNLQFGGLISNGNILTVIDFDKESCTKRFYLIDLINKKLLLNTWVAHGKNSGGDKPDHFSNVINSNESSLGFYLTGEAYFGSNGRSMRLDGLDEDFNDNARVRAIVLHGADYVSQDCIDELGRLGRSFGCPAVPILFSDSVIDMTTNGSVMFINHSDDAYNSKYLDVKTASLVSRQQSNFIVRL